MSAGQISDREFTDIRSLLYRVAGIRLGDEKKALVCGRLGRRLGARGVGSFGDYYALITSDREAAELQMAIDLLTTNETYFFREPKHFDFLAAQLKTRLAGRAVRVWSAASSSGEEAYSIAMVLAGALGDSQWEVVASDLSTRVLDRARTGHYSLERSQGIPQRYLSAYCLKGVGPQQGTLLVAKTLRQRVSFRQANLIDLPGNLGTFDLIFLRNVLIYFDPPTKRRVVEGVAAHLKPGGHLLVGHSESLNGITEVVLPEAPAIYRKR